jgi:hypothetical protein
MQPLFQDVEELSFGKVATFKLPPDSGQWITEILKHFHEKHPWVGKYLTSVEIKEKNPEEGFGFGWVEIKASSEESSPSVKVPVLIKDNELLPLDTIMTPKGKYYPMSPRRLDEALFRSDLFEKMVDADELKQQEVVSPFSYQDAYPDQRWGYLGGGSFKIGSLLDSITDTVYKKDIDHFVEKVSGDDVLIKKAFANTSYFKCMKKLQEAEKTASTKEASLSYEDEIEGSVMQVQRLPKAQYLLKTANPNAYAPTQKILDRPTALMKLGESTIKAVDTRGTLTVTTNTSRVKAAADETEYQPTGESGRYHVTSLTGSPVTGLVFSSIIGCSGEEVPLRLFISDSGYSMQDEIVGKKIKGLALEDVSEGPPKGFGLFFWDDEGSIKATEPFFVVGVGNSGEGKTITVHTMMGDQKKVVPSAVKNAVGADDSLLVPKRAKFHPITNDKPMPLTGSTGSAEKNASLRNFDRKVTITAIDGSRFNFTGQCGLEKLSRKETHNLYFDDAVFLGTVLGMSPEFAETKLAKALNYGNTTVTGLHPIKPIEEYEKEAEAQLSLKKTAAMSFMDSLRHDLIKEAVIFGDEDTIDKVLSLNFLNPDNIKVFVEYLPELEDAQQRMSKLLIATRLGLEELDEAALTNAIQGMEKTIDGLKVLLHTLPTP